jgi:hypothetical protein
MNKTIAIILFIALCGCNEHQIESQLQGNRIQFRDFNYESGASLSIVSVDSIEFLVNHRTGHMVRITEGGDK